MGEEITNGPVTLRQHMESILDEKDRALEMAGDEREKAASALRNEQYRREDMASREREKAAENLKIELARSIKEGDDRLREHISNQIMQINAALVSADKLEQARIHSVSEKFDLQQSNHETAQLKFEKEVSNRFETVNEFRASLDDLGKQMATRRETESNIANVADAVEKARQERQHQIDDLRGTLDELRSRLDVGAPQIPELQAFVNSNLGRREGVSSSTGMIIGGVGLIATVLTIVIVLANVFTGQ